MEIIKEEYSKVGIKDIFSGITDFFKQQVEKEKSDLERQIAEIKSNETGNIEKLEQSIIPSISSKKIKKREVITSTKTLTNKEQIQEQSKEIVEEMDLEK